MAGQEKEGGGVEERMREYRKGNWTVQETMILIEAKKMDDERRKISRSKQGAGTSQQHQHQQQQQPLRWKWVEEYCWRRGCQRSQNQCNDKWDNLMRDYKKVREYQRNLDDANNNTNNKPYWEMDRGERKEKGLPTNMLPQIYQALYEVVEKPSLPTTPIATTSSPVVVDVPPVALLPPPSILSLPPPHPPQLPLPLPLPPPTLAYYPHQHVQQPPQPSTTLDSESEHSESPAKRRKSRDHPEQQPIATTSATVATAAATTTSEAVATTTTQTQPLSTTPTTNLQEVGNAICRSATMIAEAIQASEERQETRHREIVNLHQTSLRLQESRTEIHRQGLTALTDAINNLANSILHMANSQKREGPSS